MCRTASRCGSDFAEPAGRLGAPFPSRFTGRNVVKIVIGVCGTTQSQVFSLVLVPGQAQHDRLAGGFDAVVVPISNVLLAGEAVIPDGRSVLL